MGDYSLYAALVCVFMMIAIVAVVVLVNVFDNLLGDDHV